MTRLLKLLDSTTGATAAEYALILAIIGAGIVLGSLALGHAVGNSMNRTATCISTSGADCE